MATYWLLDWLDEEGISDLGALDDVLRTPAGYERIIIAADVARSHAPEPIGAGRSLVAGTGLDLSGVLGCGMAECLKQTVDDLVYRSWCYFDRIIVSGLDPNEFIVRTAQGDRQLHRKMVANHVAAALHIRSIGAEELFTFRRKAQLCTDHMNQHAAEAGMPPTDAAVDELTRELSKGFELSLRETRSGLRYTFQHPLISTTTTGTLERRMPRSRIGPYIARVQAKRVVAGLTRSVWLSRDVRGALGQSALKEGKYYDLRGSSDRSVADVALTLRLPAIEGATVDQLLVLRRDEPEEFEVFRGALVRTIEERLKALPSEDAQHVGASVVDDVLTPAVAALELRMKRSTRLLGARSAVAVTAGGILTTVGLLTFAPLVVPGLVLASGGLVANYADFLKDRREIDLADLHFLWRADERIHS
ncbi:hypothetical protein ABTX24_02355 [Nocardioides sp. NPDC127514]|uniref:hypothetical protein n=1 Tax=unclassified Nocardioides TaxID=2615069 RepID=UPI00135CE1E6